MRRTLRLLLLGLLSASVLLSTGCGSEAADGPEAASTTSRPVGLKADTPWFRPVLSADGRTLTLNVGSSPEGTGPCEQKFRHEVTETTDDVTIAFDLVEPGPPTATTEPAACPAMMSPQQFRIDLDAPLGDRDVYDGLRGRAQDISRLSDVVTPEVLPDGVTVSGLARSPNDAGSDNWTQRGRVPSGPGWDLFIDQGPAGSFEPPTTAPGTVIDTIEVHGNEAEIYEYFNSTGRLILWTEEGLDITVRAELHTVDMSEPPSFANPDVAFIDAVLVEVADGIVVP